MLALTYQSINGSNATACLTRYLLCHCQYSYLIIASLQKYLACHYLGIC